MLVRMVLYSCGLTSASRSSADTNLSMISVLRGLSSSARMTKMCAWGRPRFWNSTT
ncbi:hypothetical protein PF005_g33366 [Phytophthora fragariae]|uniref:Uncharacterized protein n=1 Tax=Phytophthora fragariae TaxID=53985 RepID=A0A6A4B975_9STRA|nr:hypothetical protein PF005_g33366 [Phytophthora fragariae]KAE9269246.1 hypothetical protein PF001_g29308 [Phytophthora fragariae]